MGKRIAILGTAEGWKDAPFSDKGWEIWVCNRAGLNQTPWHRLFEIHRNWDYENRQAKAKYLSRLREIRPPRKVVSIVPLEDVAANVVIDRQALFGRYGAIWFSSTFGYMLACAIDEKPKEIALHGVNLASHEEYAAQFPAVLHFIAVAKERGIKVTIPDRSALHRQPSPYADRFETALALFLERKAGELQERIARAESTVVGCRETYWYRRGLEATLDATEDTADKGESRIDTLHRTLRVSEASLNRLKGMLMAIQHVRRLFVWNILPPELGEETDADIDDLGPA